MRLPRFDLDGSILRVTSIGSDLVVHMFSANRGLLRMQGNIGVRSLRAS